MVEIGVIYPVLRKKAKKIEGQEAKPETPGDDDAEVAAAAANAGAAAADAAAAKAAQEATAASEMINEKVVNQWMSSFRGPPIHLIQTPYDIVGWSHLIPDMTHGMHMHAQFGIFRMSASWTVPSGPRPFNSSGYRGKPANFISEWDPQFISGSLKPMPDHVPCLNCSRRSWQIAMPTFALGHQR